MASIKETTSACKRKNNSVQLLIATKRQSPEKILPLLIQGQRVFGENRIQEAKLKWMEFKTQFPDIELHLIGHLQTNKVKEAVFLFDVIQTLDSLKLAEKLTKEEKKQSRYLKYYIEINMAHEQQKTGVPLLDCDQFIKNIKENYPLHVIGVMCIPPVLQDPQPFFKHLKEIATKHQLSEISMGMSQDYQTAICCGATLVRVGSAIFSGKS